jgi:hypothetical protein
MPSLRLQIPYHTLSSDNAEQCISVRYYFLCFLRFRIPGVSLEHTTKEYNPLIILPYYVLFEFCENITQI